MGTGNWLRFELSTNSYIFFDIFLALPSAGFWKQKDRAEGLEIKQQLLTGASPT